MVKKNIKTIILSGIILLFLFLVVVLRNRGFNEKPLPFIMGALMTIVHLLF